jgi:ATPase complex subunit ATP10
VEEATKSYFADVHGKRTTCPHTLSLSFFLTGLPFSFCLYIEMRKHGGKMYYASNKLTKPEKAGYMPDFEGSNVNREKVHTTEKLLGKISLMSFVYAKYGEPHVNSFVEPFLAKFKGTDGVQCIEVSMPWLVSVIILID